MIRSVILLFVGISLSFKFEIENDTKCSLNVSELAKNRQPLLLVKNKNNYELMIPENLDDKSVISFEEDGKYFLFCPGKNNKLSKTNRDLISTQCVNNEIFLLDKEWENVSDRQCVNPITPELKRTEIACGENMKGEIFEAGYQINDLGIWLPLYKVCHDVENMNTFYSTYTLYGKAIKARQVNVPRPDFMVGNLDFLYEGISPNSLYTKASEVETVKKILKIEDVSGFVDLQNKYLSRGHLTPDADMLFSNWKLVTYFLINVVPQWQSINAGNWVRVEKTVRDTAALLQDNLIIITGTLGTMTLPSGSTRKKIYLAPGEKIKVPEYLWKIVYQEKTKKAIVIITSNNPYLTEITPLCNDICKEYKWPLKFTMIYKGFTYCCKFEEFKSLTKVPNLQVTETLEYPGKSPKEKFQSAVRKVIANNRKLKANKKENKE